MLRRRRKGSKSALGVSEFERVGPRPAEPLELEPSDGDGAACGAPGGGTGFGAIAVVSGSEVREGDGVGVMTDGSPGFEGPAGGGGVNHAACWVAVQEADCGEGTALSLGP